MPIKKAKTIDLKGKDYATVPERLKLFREDCPKGSIKTEYKIENEMLFFTATIIKDRGDDASAEAMGHSMTKMTNQQKEFEKQETIAIGRALAILGYLGSGEIASTEEMEQFNEYRDQQKEIAINKAIAELEEAKTIDELKKIYVRLGVLIKEDKIVKAKDKRKAELSDASNKD